MRILLLGKNGQLGWELCRTLLPLGEVLAFGTKELDFTHLRELREQVLYSRAQLIINAAAYTAVDQAETQPDRIHLINTRAPELLADLAYQMQAVLVHYSTDYVFDGTKNTPYTEDDIPHPVNAYGASKLAGDSAIEDVDCAYLILRPSWIYSQRRDNFVKKVLHWAHTYTELKVVTDQIGCPTWARYLAEATAQMLARGRNDWYDWIRERRGVYHLASSGYASRFAWAEEIIRMDPNRGTQTVRELKPAKTDDFPALASRPHFTVLDCTCAARVFGLHLPDWRVGLEAMLQEA